ncbi:MAG: polyribonucleotide nucleotidyltransferase [Bacteroidota bacterium]|nr:polyribonucleotide nucleotidyltransferase [Bacteroidota bacterium]
MPSLSLPMLPNHHTITFTLADGKEISIETGKLAKQADGSVVIKVGNTMLLATVCSTKDAKEGVDFMPLTVDYQEKYAAVGRFPGGFLKREARPSDYEILISRLIDRALRPMFPDDYHADTQVNVFLISSDTDTPPDAYAAFAASCALAVSDIPFNGPISEVRVAKINGELKINPTVSELASATLDFIVAATQKDILMVEGEASEISEDEMIEALALAHDAIRIQCKAQIDLANKVGSLTKRTYSHEVNDLELKENLFKLLYDKVYEVARKANPNKQERGEAFKKVLEDYMTTLPADTTDQVKSLIKKYYHDIEKEASRNIVLNEKIRLDGRKTDEIRPIWSEIGYLPMPHGSAIFTRGETQSLTTVTLGTKLDEQMLDGAMNSGYSKFLLHYNFPGFSTGEVKPNRGIGRREVGHGNLALRALKKVLPAEADFPYTIRVVSDILESNGSSSMATVCAGSLALMDAGVPIKSGVSGIAMGLITDTKTGKYAVLSDILGDEDHLGDMDFKVTGTSKGITACQMDLKIDGLKFEVLKEALAQAKKGREHILNEMNKTISAPATDLKPHSPRMVQLKIDKEFIGAIIGPGGKIIQEMQRATGAVINIEEVDNKGVVNIFAANKDAIDAALARIKGIVTIPEVGEVYDGIVKAIQTYGAFVEFLPGKDGLLHISEIKWERLENMEGVLEVGEHIKVKLIDVDPKTGKFKLSRKVLIPKPVTSEV